MKFRLFIDYTTDYEIKTGKKYKNIEIGAINEITALKVTDMYINDDLWEERQNIYCVNIYRVRRSYPEVFIARYRFNFDEDGRFFATIDWNE